MKIRNDFVSNSSSSSYILSTKKTPLQIAKHFAYNKEEIQLYRSYMENNVAMTLKPLYWIPKKKNPRGEYWNGVRACRCIPRSKLGKYFDDAGNVRKDLNIHNICKGEFTDVFESNTAVCGQITKETIAFCKWLFKEMSEKKDNSIWALNDEYMYFINRIENEIKKKKLYVMYFSYDGECTQDGMIFLGTGDYRWPRIKEGGFDYCYSYNDD